MSRDLLEKLASKLAIESRHMLNEQAAFTISVLGHMIEEVLAEAREQGDRESDPVPNDGCACLNPSFIGGCECGCVFSAIGNPLNFCSKHHPNANRRNG